MKKTHYLKNGEFDQKSAWNKKDVKLNFPSDIFYKISCIFNLNGFYFRNSFFKKTSISAIL